MRKFKRNDVVYITNKYTQKDEKNTYSSIHHNYNFGDEVIVVYEYSDGGYLISDKKRTTHEITSKKYPIMKVEEVEIMTEEELFMCAESVPDLEADINSLKDDSLLKKYLQHADI